MQRETPVEKPKTTLESVPDLQQWFDQPPISGVRHKTTPPPPAVEKVGEFLGDPDIDAWLR